MQRSSSETAGVVRPARRPAGWTAPGPPPAGARGRADLAPGPGEDLCHLVGDWRIFQRVDGHRWSLDDLVTAAVAADGPAPRRALDLGCGIGSVLLMVAWAFPDARLIGVEAQAISAALARRSIRYDGCEYRVEIAVGDLRDAALLPADSFDLITGTPPYFAPGTHTRSEAVQRGPCRHELRGGVEDYVRAAAGRLAASGRFVFCCADRQREHALAVLETAGLRPRREVEVVPRAGKPPLVAVFEAVRASEAGGASSERETLTVRGPDGQWTEGFRALRARMGMPDVPP